MFTTVAAAVRAIVSPRRAPGVAFEENSTTATRGRYEGGRHNRVHVRVRGSLDEPSVDHDLIRAAVLHEIGHWADRWGRASDYGIAAGLAMTYAGFLVLGVGLGGVMLPPHDIALVVAIMLAGVVITALGFQTITAWSCPAGRRARIPITHPRLQRRTARLTRTLPT